jgi:arabinofuranosyltransferase
VTFLQPTVDKDVPATARTRRVTEAFLIAGFTYIFLANTWLGDDAYITFRVVWNFLHGYGLVFNPGERVQAYSHPLWMFVIAAAHAVTREFFFTALAVSYGFALAAALVVMRRATSVAGAAVVFLWLASSKAFIDYTSSGLENPLSYLLLALFYPRFCALNADEPLTGRDLRRYGLLAGLAFVNRMDSVLMFAAPLAWLAVRAVRRDDERLPPLLLGFGVPAIAWVLFATFYYGFPLPNTYYAKVATGVPSSLLYRQGIAYVLNSFGHDPITLGTVGIAVGLAMRSSPPMKLAAASCLLYIAYTISVGGDFMTGRFFVMPFFVSAIAVFQALREFNHKIGVAAALVLYNVLMPLVPVKTTANYDAAWPWRSQNGLKDERGHYHRITNIFFFSPFRELPDHTWIREGRSFSQGPDKVTVQGSIGYYGLMAGPEKHLVDRNALSDPLLARLPVSRQLYFEFYMGHFFRDIPDGYLESVARDGNYIVDPLVHDYYDRLRDVIKGPLLRMSRFRNMWYLNAGEGRQFARRYDARRPVALSVRAANERFATDVGERDAAGGVIRSTGRSGYLQYGPDIPMKAGTYRARWLGTVADASAGPVGFVDVWVGNRRVARKEVSTSDVIADSHQIAEISFVLDRPVNRLEYRFWVDGHRLIVLERVELMSGPAAVEYR